MSEAGTETKLPPPPNPNGPATFTQEQLDRIATQQKEEGKRAGERKLLEDLGVTSTNDLRELIKKAQDADAATKTEAEKAKADADKARAAADKAKADAEEEKLKARKMMELVKAGVKLERLDAATRLLDISNDVSDADAVTAAKGLAKEFPEFFSTGGGGEGDGGETNNPPPAGAQPPQPKQTSAGAPPRGKIMPRQDVKSKVDELLAERHPNLKKKGT